jgi:hypothetical protein
MERRRAAPCHRQPSGYIEHGYRRSGIYQSVGVRIGDAVESGVAGRTLTKASEAGGKVRLAAQGCMENGQQRVGALRVGVRVE